MLTPVVKTTGVIVTSAMSGTVVFFAFTGNGAEFQLLRTSLLFTTFLSHGLYVLEGRGSLNFLPYSQMSNLNPHAKSWKPAGLSANAEEWNPASTRNTRNSRKFVKSVRAFNALGRLQMAQYARNINRARNGNSKHRSRSKSKNKNKNNRTRRY